MLRRLPEIMEYFGSAEFPALGEDRIAAKRRRDIIGVLEAALRLARGEA